MIKLNSTLPFFLSLIVIGSCLHAQEKTKSGENEAVTKKLTEFHLAASKADGKKYFGCLASDAIFLGTDATERWTVDQFKAYAAPYFNQGKGWTYVASERNVYLSPDKKFAWFDERLQNEKYGEVRGTGVLRKSAEGWLITQYNMSFPVPNELTADLISKIREQSKK